MKARNFVRKVMQKANCCSKIEPNRRQQLLDVAQTKESLESVLEAKIDGKYLNYDEEEE